jgi:hypothetical protein
MPMPDAAFAGVTEKEWLATVIEIATTYGWMSYHTHDSRHSAKGFPDCVFAHETQARVVFVELKREKARLTPEQTLWGATLRAAGQDVYVWRPSDVDRVHDLLGGG